MPCPPPPPVRTALVGTVGLCVEMEMGSKIELHSQDLHCSLSHVLWVLGSWMPPLGSHRTPGAHGKWFAGCVRQPSPTDRSWEAWASFLNTV